MPTTLERETCLRCDGQGKVIPANFGVVAAYPHMPQHSARTCRLCDGQGKMPIIPNGMAILEVYADGGVVAVNPSPIAGTWAFLILGEDGLGYIIRSGHVTPDEIGLPTVSNNLTELLALLIALEQLPDGWTGKVFTDSFVTLTRFRQDYRAKFNGIPKDLVDRVAAVKSRLGRYELVLLGGHPTRADLRQGFQVRDHGGTLPVSPFNKMCDDACTAIADTIKRQRLATESS